MFYIIKIYYIIYKLNININEKVNICKYFSVKSKVDNCVLIFILSVSLLINLIIIYSLNKKIINNLKNIIV